MNTWLAAIATVAALASTAAQQVSAGDAPTQQDCIQINASCEAIMSRAFGPLTPPEEITKQCAPAFQACNARTAAATTGTSSMTATVLLDVDVYDVPGGTGKVIGMLKKDLKVALAEPCVDNWCHVEGEGVPGGKGFVYSGPDYLSLQF